MQLASFLNQPNLCHLVRAAQSSEPATDLNPVANLYVVEELFLDRRRNFFSVDLKVKPI